MDHHRLHFFSSTLILSYIFWKKFQQNEIQGFSPQFQNASYQIEETSTVIQKTEMNLKCSENDTSDSNKSEETVQTFQSINPVTNGFYSDTALSWTYLAILEYHLKNLIYLLLNLSLKNTQSF